MRRQRSVSFYAENEKEYIEEYNKNKTLSERRRNRFRKTTEDLDPDSINSPFRKKFFESYDDLELDQLGVNSTFQIEVDEKEDESKLIKQIKNINLSIKEKNQNSFWSNVTELSKNIICTNLPKKKNKASLFRIRSGECGIKASIISNKNLLDEKDNSISDGEDSDCDEDNLGFNTKKNYHMTLRYNLRHKSDLNKKYDIDYEDDGEENLGVSNNRTPITHLKKIKETNDDNNDDEEPIKIDYITNENEEKNEKIEQINITNNENEVQLNTEKNNRRYTFDVNLFNIDKNDEETECNTKVKNEQNKKLQDFICNNEFLSKNVDYVDMHLKFLITGSDTFSKHLFLSELLNDKNDDNEREYNSFNIFKKVIKLLGDYIKMELYEEDCDLADSIMLKTYINIVDCIFMVVNLNVKNSSTYVLNLMEKVKYKINLEQRHFTVTIVSFEFSEEKNEDIISENKDILKKVENNFDVIINYIYFDIDKDKGLKNQKFVSVINKYLSLAYLKKERKNKIPFDKNNLIRKSTFL